MGQVNSKKGIPKGLQRHGVLRGRGTYLGHGRSNTDQFHFMLCSTSSDSDVQRALGTPESRAAAAGPSRMVT